ncbi:MAG: integrase arm-type DNA-binding domain-containing protein [Rickettsiales bacterium]|nr:integrase arm-type DNA-binding domain-containing protein [Rickettsiales bacterium]
MSVPLSDAKCKAAKPKEKLYKLSDRYGLSLHVNPSGTKKWRKKFYFHGKEQTYTIGDYPAISLAAARQETLTVNEWVKKGQNPNTLKKLKKQAQIAKHEHSFKKLALEWHGKKVDTWSERHGFNILRRLEKDVFPYIGNHPITEIKTTELAAVLDKMEARKVHDLANRTRQYCESVFKYAISRGIAENNPAYNLRGSLTAPKSEHFPAIPFKELGQLLRNISINQGRHFPASINATKLTLLTFLRSNELRGGRWEEIDFEKKTWVIPAKRMKGNREHLVPLSKQSITLLSCYLMHLNQPWLRK